MKAIGVTPASPLRTKNGRIQKKRKGGAELRLDWDRFYLAPMKYCLRFGEETSTLTDTASWMLSKHCSCTARPPCFTIRASIWQLVPRMRKIKKRGGGGGGGFGPYTPLPLDPPLNWHYQPAVPEAASDCVCHPVRSPCLCWHSPLLGSRRHSAHSAATQSHLQVTWQVTWYTP